MDASRARLDALASRRDERIDSMARHVDRAELPDPHRFDDAGLGDRVGTPVHRDVLGLRPWGSHERQRTCDRSWDQAKSRVITTTLSDLFST